jgi:DNA-binding GntR family transcriptional regulator
MTALSPASGTPAATLLAAPRIDRRPLHEHAADRLRDMIAEGELPAGVVIPELELCAALGVSRTPIREALKLLVVDGLVEHLPQRGFTVRVLQLDEARQMLELLAELEAFGAELACARADGAGLDHLAELHAGMLGRRDAGDMPGYFRLNQAIHDGLMALSGNQPLVESHRRLTLALRRVRFLSNRTTADWDASVKDHEEILALLRARDAAGLRALMRRHALDIWKVVGPTLEQARPAVPPSPVRQAG